MADLGDLIPLGIQVRDEDGVPVNASSVILTITQPDGTMVAPVVTNPPAETGEYTYDYLPLTVGRYLVKWTTTGPNAAFSDSFDARESHLNSILSLAVAKAHLNMSQDRTADDDELRAMIEAVTAVIERHRGEVVARRTIVEDNPAGSGAHIALLYHPVVSVTSMLDVNGAAMATGDYFLDAQNGILTALGGVGRKPRRVTYVAGYMSVPANYILAAKIILGHLWQTQRIQNIGTQPTLGNQSRREDAIVTPSGMGYAIPHRAIELLGGRPSVVI